MTLKKTIWVELQTKSGKKILFCTIYREFYVPKMGASTELHTNSHEHQMHRLISFGRNMSIASSENKPLYLMGDCNLDLMRADDSTFYLKNILREYESILGENGLTNKRLGITFERIHEDGTVIQSELDHLVTNCPDEIKDYGTLIFDKSDHRVIFAEIYFDKQKAEKKTVVTRDLRAIRKNPQLLKEAVTKQDWYQLLGMESVDEMVEIWTKQITAALDQVAPKKEKVLKDGKGKPNWSPEVLQKIKHKNDLRLEVQKSKSITTGKVDTKLHEEYKGCRNKCNNLVTIGHRNFMGTNITKTSTMNQIWKTVNKIIAPRESSKLTIQVKGPVKGKLEDPEHVADELNHWFKEKVEKLVIKIDKSELQDPFEKLIAKLKDKKLKFSLKPVDVQDVLKVLKDLKKKTSCGLDGLSSEMLKECKEELAGPLTIIINRSICSGIFPKDWKIAKIAPLLKKGDATKRENYRPVALLCVAGMILEKIVADQIERFFESNNLLGTFQFGFRKNRSTVSELLTLFETLQEAREQNKMILQILYDLSAAFDTVEPRVIIEKLKIYGFDYIARKWMETYLTGRSQITTVGGKQSEPVELGYGTPQGSRLSPLLFIILMADLDLWTSDSILSNFADDTQSVIISEDEESLKLTAKNESQTVVAHFSANNLVNNADKAALLFNNKGKAETITMEIAGEELKSQEHEKLLGIRVASDMGFKNHIENICGKMNQRLSILRRLNNKIPREKLRIIAGAIFTSVARYGIAVYSKPRLHSDPMSEDTHKLQVIQNKMFRLLTGKTLLDRVRVEDLGRKLAMMSINQMTCYHILTETFNIINYGASEKIQIKLLPRSATSSNLTVPLCRKTSCRSFSFYASRLWNKLPVDIRARAMPASLIKNNPKAELNRLNNFKKEIKKWIWNGGVPFK